MGYYAFKHMNKHGWLVHYLILIWIFYYRTMNLLIADWEGICLKDLYQLCVKGKMLDFDQQGHCEC